MQGRVSVEGLLAALQVQKTPTGSAGLSRHKRKYYYYHCTKGCSEIYSTKRVHDAFEEVLRSVVAKKDMMDLYEQILKAFFEQTSGERTDSIEKLQAQINRNKERINKAQQMMLDSEIAPAEYKLSSRDMMT